MNWWQEAFPFILVLALQHPLIRGGILKTPVFPRLQCAMLAEGVQISEKKEKKILLTGVTLLVSCRRHANQYEQHRSESMEAEQSHTHTHDSSPSGITMRKGKRCYQCCFKNRQPQVEGGKNKQERKSLFQKKRKEKGPKCHRKITLLKSCSSLALIVSVITPRASKVCTLNSWKRRRKTKKKMSSSSVTFEYMNNLVHQKFQGQQIEKKDRKKTPPHSSDIYNLHAVKLGRRLSLEANVCQRVCKGRRLKSHSFSFSAVFSAAFICRQRRRQLMSRGGSWRPNVNSITFIIGCSSSCNEIFCRTCFFHMFI